MTVCLGAIAKPMIILASDRMITSGDIQFEQQQPKIFEIAPTTLAMISGDIAVQTALVDSTRAASIGLKTTREIAAVFADKYAAYCRRKAEADVLKPLGVASTDDLMKRKWPAPVVADLLEQIQRASANDDVGTIIAGQDATGPHLYVIDYAGKYSVHDRIGFAAVGIGRRHAESQFMFAGYTPDWLFPRALYLTYTAKKRAEVAPGVGKYTDIAVLGGGDKPSVVRLDITEFLPALEKVYTAERAEIDKIHQLSEGQIEEAIKKILNIPPTTPPTGLPSGPAVPPVPPTPTHDPKDQPPSPG